MSHRLLFAIVFIEGFCSLGAEVIALRQIVPHMGSSIMVTAPTIGFFLLALALGYHAGARIDQGYRQVVARNFLIAAALSGLGLAGVTVDFVFDYFNPPTLAYLVLMAAALCPLAWLLGQTVPILTNLLQHERSGQASGFALYYSTLGSFLGSLTLSLLVMQWLGVSAAVAICALLLVAGFVLLRGCGWYGWHDWRALSSAATVLALVAGANTVLRPVIETAYANYSIIPVKLDGALNPRAFKNNNSVASLIDESDPPRYARYVRYIRRILLDDLALRGQEILVLGAGGFTISHREASNHYTYVDIDPAIRRIAEQRFLGEAALGEFVADDARRFVVRSAARFAAEIVDVYSSHSSIPGHLVTQEFWHSTRRVLKPDGVLIANLILDNKLATPYARNLLATIESVYGRCAVEVLHRQQALSNVIVLCHNGNQPSADSLYVDERNTADFDLARSR